MSRTITARRLITAIGVVEYPAITVDDAGLITDISTDTSIRSELTLTPALVDVHLHGAAGHDVMDADPEGLARMQRFLAGRGTAHYLATTVTAAVDPTLAALERLATAVEAETRPGEAQALGIHLEGPFLSHGKRGVHPAALLQAPDIALFDRFQTAARGSIKLLTLAPEVPGAVQLIEHAAAQGIRVSLGHTDATAAEARAAIAAGASSATHTFNAMRALNHREPGVLGVVLDDKSLYAELICDGVHVAPELVRLWLRSKGDHALLVTDSISATGMPDGDYTLGGLAVRVEGQRCTLVEAAETLAGSVLTLDRAVSNLIALSGCDLATAVRAASSQPARMLGLEKTLTSVRAGQPADLCAFTPQGRLETTYLRGQAIIPS